MATLYKDSFDDLSRVTTVITAGTVVSSGGVVVLTRTGGSGFNTHGFYTNDPGINYAAGMVIYYQERRTTASGSHTYFGIMEKQPQLGFADAGNGGLFHSIKAWDTGQDPDAFRYNAAENGSTTSSPNFDGTALDEWVDIRAVVEVDGSITLSGRVSDNPGDFDETSPTPWTQFGTHNLANAASYLASSYPVILSINSTLGNLEVDEFIITDDGVTTKAGGAGSRSGKYIIASGEG